MQEGTVNPVEAESWKVPLWRLNGGWVLFEMLLGSLMGNSDNSNVLPAMKKD
ncbi:hypothetical protein NEUTE2DRAFT_72809 [Neurospora tetrasperma FGSC 2509]|nr:hypothetical protein NEUTE2DRAFT_72809 [Neurospora tetrasperma FGSC 2509]